MFRRNRFQLTEERITNEDELNDINFLAKHIIKYLDKPTKKHMHDITYHIDNITIDNCDFCVEITRFNNMTLNFDMLKEEIYTYHFILNDNFDNEKQNYYCNHGISDESIDKILINNNQEEIKSFIRFNSYHSKYLIDKYNKYILKIKKGEEDIDIKKLIEISYNWNFSIKSNEIIVNHNDNLVLTSDTFSSLEDGLESLITVRKTHLLYENTILSPYEYKIINIENKLFSIRDTNECCVCLKQTEGKTSCNHSICLPCRIKSVKSNIKNCPMCRSDCNLYNIDNNDDDE